MRCLTLCVALLVLPATFADEKPDPKGEKVTTKDGKTSAVFPSKPSEQKIGNLVMHNLQSKDGKSALMLFNQNTLLKVIDLTDKAIVKKTFEDGRDAGIRSVRGKLLSNKNIKLGKLPGYTFDAAWEGGIYRSRLYLTEKSLTQVVVSGSKEFVDSADAKKFLDSLEIDTETKEERITTKDGKVSAVFPNKPTKTTSRNLLIYFYESKDGKTVFLLNQAELPKEVDLTDKELVKQVFDQLRETDILKSKRKLRSKKDLEFGKYPGQSFDLEASTGVIRKRIYLTEKSLVQIIVSGPKEFVDGPEAKKFLDSLKIEK